jgi:hypothetical protein
LKPSEIIKSLGLSINISLQDTRHKKTRSNEILKKRDRCFINYMQKLTLIFNKAICVFFKPKLSCSVSIYQNDLIEESIL